MPAEWEPHEGTWLIWPHEDTHEYSQLHLEHLWLEMTMALCEHETVHIHQKMGWDGQIGPTKPKVARR